MLPHIYDRNDLIAMLRWQFEIGIDEALLDFPDALASPIKLDELLSQINTTTNFPAKLLEGSITGSRSERVIKQLPSKNGRATDSSVVAAHPSLPNTTDLSNITNLVDLRARLDSLDDCPLKHTASNLCFADGNPGARVMIIGEVPGRDEDEAGRVVREDVGGIGPAGREAEAFRGALRGGSRGGDHRPERDARRLSQQRQQHARHASEVVEERERDQQKRQRNELGDVGAQVLAGVRGEDRDARVVDQLRTSLRRDDKPRYAFLYRRMGWGLSFSKQMLESLLIYAPSVVLAPDLAPTR